MVRESSKKLVKGPYQYLLLCGWPNSLPTLSWFMIGSRRVLLWRIWGISFHHREDMRDIIPSPWNQRSIIGYDSGHIGNPFSPLFSPHRSEYLPPSHLMWPRINNEKILDTKWQIDSVLPLYSIYPALVCKPQKIQYNLTTTVIFFFSYISLL